MVHGKTHLISLVLILRNDRMKSAVMNPVSVSICAEPESQINDFQFELNAVAENKL